MVIFLHTTPCKKITIRVAKRRAASLYDTNFITLPGAAAGYCILLVSSYTVAVCDCVFHLYDFFLTQSQSSTVYFICTISFLHSRRTVTVYFFCTISSSSFFCQHFSDLYLEHDLTDFNQTWSQVPFDHPIYATWPDWGQRSHRGHRGQKGNFH